MNEIKVAVVPVYGTRCKHKTIERQKTNTPHANNSSDMLCLSWLQALAVVAGRLAKKVAIKRAQKACFLPSMSKFAQFYCAKLHIILYF